MNPQEYISELAEQTVGEFASEKQSIRRAFLSFIVLHHYADCVAVSLGCDISAVRDDLCAEFDRWALVQDVANLAKHIELSRYRSPDGEVYVSIENIGTGKGSAFDDGTYFDDGTSFSDIEDVVRFESGPDGTPIDLLWLAQEGLAAITRHARGLTDTKNGVDEGRRLGSE